MIARANPFAVDRVLRIRYELLAGSLDDLLVRLEQMGSRGAIVGPHGSGKTTLLEDLAAKYETRGKRVHLLRLSAERRAVPRETMHALCVAPRSADAVFCDGAEQLGPLAWRVFRYRVRRAKLLLVTTHRPGRLPTLLETSTTPELLERIIRRLLRSRDATSAERLPYSVPELHAQHQGNLREALRELYDRYAEGEFCAPALHQRTLMR